jgi:hypothetical protein
MESPETAITAIDLKDKKEQMANAIARIELAIEKLKLKNHMRNQILTELDTHISNFAKLIDNPKEY